MRRNVDALSGSFDVLVVGAGMHGVAVARLAAIAGFRTALIERDDFCSSTSRNSAKLIHGGLRYIQHLDFARVRESAVAQREWRIAAPNLVRPLRFVIPTRGWGARGPAALAAGIALFQVIAAGRNRGVPSADRLPAAGMIGRRRLLAEFPMLDRPGVSGGAHWHDAQALDAPRLAMACIEDAIGAGAIAVNHVEAIRLIVADSTVRRVVAMDRLTGRELEIRARLVIDATGPWTGRLAQASGYLRDRSTRLSRHVNLVTRRILPGDTAIGITSTYAADAIVGGSQRLLFVSPWRDCSIVGTWHDEYEGDPADLRVAPHEIENWLAELNEALPGADLSPGDVRSVHSGLIPMAAGHAGRGARDHLTEHSRDGLHGLISVAGVKLTTAPTTARRVVRLAGAVLGAGRAANAVTFARPMPGTHGDRATAVLATCNDGDLPPGDRAFRCRALYAVRNEMAVTLRDVLFRATDDAERGVLTNENLDWAAEAMSAELAWTAERRATELAAARSRLEAMRPFPPAAGAGADPG
jgi:glycerol-3-phosphate dehydrogenase